MLSHQTAFWENQDGLSSTTSGSGDDGVGSLQFKNITTKVLQQSYLPVYHYRIDHMVWQVQLVPALEGAFYGSFHDGVKTQDMKALMLLVCMLETNSSTTTSSRPPIDIRKLRLCSKRKEVSFSAVQ